jgi:type I site-specific restriction endonuclease
MNKKDLSERDICSKFIGPAVKRAGWDGMMQIREEVNFTKGRIIVRGKLVTRGKAKRADYILYYKPNIPIAIIEAKDNNHSVGSTHSNRFRNTRVHVTQGRPNWPNADSLVSRPFRRIVHAAMDNATIHPGL